MPMWSPPTPPHDDNDVYMDQTLLFLYEPTVMPEAQLPPVYVKKERKKIKVESITTRKQKQKREEQPRVPRSLFDRANAQLLRLRRDAKLQMKLKMSGNLKPYRPAISTLQPTKPVMEQAPDHPEWLIHEDWALLQAVQNYFDVPLNLIIVNPAHTPNWDMVADVVNSCSRVYRSPKQCRLRYETVIIPREEGRIMYDITPRKQKKQKGIYKMTKSNRAMKTGQIHTQDSNNGVTILYSLRFDSTKSIAAKRPPTMRQTLVNPTLKNPKHASVLQENNIQYEQPLNPMQVAEIRAQRIQREKKTQQQQQAAQQASADQQNTATTTQRLTQQAALPSSQTPTIVSMTTAVTATQLATIGTSASSATVLTVTGTPLAQANIRGRPPLTVQEIPSGASVGQVGAATPQVRAQLQTVSASGTTALTQIQLAQRFTSPSTPSAVQPQLQAANKTITPDQLRLLQQQQALLSRPKQAVLQQQQLRMQKQPTGTLIDRLPQQQLRQIKGTGIQGQKTVIAQQLVTSMGGGHLKTPAGITRPLTPEDMARLKVQPLTQQKVGGAVAGTTIAQLHPQAGQLQGTQITPLQQVSQGLTKVTGPQAAGATLVKTVTAPVISNVSINVSMPQKAGVGAKVSQISAPTMHVLQQRKPATGIPVHKTGVSSKTQIMNQLPIYPQRSGLTVQQLQQLITKQTQGGTIQQIFHSSPTIIATVTQSQATPQIGAKVIATTATIQPTQIQQSVAGASVAGNVTVASSHLVSLSQGQSSLTASIVKPGPADSVTTVQIHPISSLTQSKLPGMTQNVVVTPVQHVTVAASGVTQQTNIQSVTQVVASPSQTLQVTVPATSLVQTASPHTLPQSQRATTGSPAPLTVTVTPNPQNTSQVQGTTVTYTATPVTQPQSSGNQPQSVGEQVTILQRQPSAQATIQVQHTPSQPASQTIHIQSTGQQAASGQVSPHTVPQGKATYSMRTRNQSKPQ